VILQAVIHNVFKYLSRLHRRSQLSPKAWCT
jgi:hypothetical protein